VSTASRSFSIAVSGSRALGTTTPELMNAASSPASSTLAQVRSGMVTSPLWMV